MTPLHVACVFGTRPEAIKLAPIALAARQRRTLFTVTLIATGQHRDIGPSALDPFGLHADIDLRIMGPDQAPTDVLARVLAALPPVLESLRPGVVLVQGDTSSTLAGALCAFHAKIPVGHVEAGLRTDDLYSPFPEEMNRRLTSRVATHHFAPTETARERLLREAVDRDSIVVTGNTVIDALAHLRAALARPTGLDLPAGSRLVLLTCHRRENHGARLTGICGAMRDIAAARPDVHIVCPVHPNPAVQSVMHAAFRSVGRVHLLPPLDYRELLWLLDAATLVVTDSGGLQEEAPAFHTPALVIRDTTERPEGIEAGVARLIGTSPAAIVRETLRLLDEPEAYALMARGENPYGDGRASMRILDALAERRTTEPRAAHPAVTR
jgi:UDP-N-acetylglucosamine 2-epimerase (non-hydrolysing)